MMITSRLLLEINESLGTQGIAHGSFVPFLSSATIVSPMRVGNLLLTSSGEDIQLGPIDVERAFAPSVDVMATSARRVPTSR